MFDYLFSSYGIFSVRVDSFNIIVASKNERWYHLIWPILYRIYLFIHTIVWV